MRLDKFLKVTRIIKRRTVAKELADNGNIVVNGDPKKSSYDVKKGDIFEGKSAGFTAWKSEKRIYWRLYWDNWIICT